MAEILVFCDTEFSGLESPELISLGLVASETDAELYIELAGVRELAVKAFEHASGRSIPYRIAERRAGDIVQCWADASLVERLLGWKATRGIEAMCTDAWRWQQYCASLPGAA